MPDVVNVGSNALDVQQSDEMRPYSKVVIIVDEETSYEAGNDTGSTLEIQNPYGTQEMADNILAKIKGVQYKSYSVTDGLLDPSAELGDAVNTNGVYGGLYSQDSFFSHQFSSDFSAPKDEQLNHEFTYESPTERRITRQAYNTKVQFSITNDAIRQEIEERQNESETFRATFETQSREISAKVSQLGGERSSFGWSLIPTAFNIYSGNKNVFSCDDDGITVDGQIKARSGFIGTDLNGFSISNSNINKNKGAFDNFDNSNGVYIGTDGIALGRKTTVVDGEYVYSNMFSVDNYGRLIAQNATLTGTITAKEGRIGADSDGNGGFVIKANKIYNGTQSLSNTDAGIYLGTDGIHVRKDDSNSFKVQASNGRVTILSGMTSLSDTNATGMYFGYDGIALGGGKFKVTNSGVLTAKSGEIGGWTIGSKSIYNNASSLGSTDAGTYVGTDGILVYKDDSHNIKLQQSTGVLTVKGGKTGINKSASEQTSGVYIGSDGIALGKSGNGDDAKDAFSVKSDGTLTARVGTIGGWTIGSKSIYSGTNGLTSSTTGTYIGTDGIYIYKDASKNIKLQQSTGYLTVKGGKTGINVTSANQTNGIYIGSDGIALGKATISSGTYGDAFNVTSNGVLTARSGTIGGWNIGVNALNKVLKNSSGTITSSVGMNASNTIAFYAGQSDDPSKCAFQVTNTGQVTLTELYCQMLDTTTSGFDPGDPSTWKTWKRNKIELYNNAYKIGSGYSTISKYNSSTGKVTLSNGQTFNTATSVKLENAGWSGGKFTVKAYYTSGDKKVYLDSSVTSQQVCAGFFAGSGQYTITPYYKNGSNNVTFGGVSQQYKLGFNSSSYSASSKVQIQSTGGSQLGNTPTLDLASFWGTARGSVGIKSITFNSGVITAEADNTKKQTKTLTSHRNSTDGLSRLYRRGSVFYGKVYDSDGNLLYSNNAYWYYKTSGTALTTYYS